ncbi:MAG: hypothetical protein HQ534_00560 [Armatimonadetes bacterium]|nr:hypothetical protein [Armatimonadota bacterium]
MKQKVNENNISVKGMQIQNKLLRVTVWLLIIAVASLSLMAIPYLITYIPIFSIQVNKLSTILNLLPQTLRLLIVLILFVFLTLFFLLKIYKNSKKTSLYVLPKSFHISSMPKEDLPPKKDMIKILTSMSESNNWSPTDKESFNLNKSDINNYLNLIVHNGYANQTRYIKDRFGLISYKIYEITPKGSNFLIKHK